MHKLSEEEQCKEKEIVHYATRKENTFFHRM